MLNKPKVFGKTMKSIMNKYLILSLITFSSSAAVCQKRDTVYLDYKGHKTTKPYAFNYSVRFFDPDMKLYYFMDYSMRGKLLHEGYSSSRRKDRKERKHIWYYAHGKIKATAYYKHNKQFGPYTEYYKDGRYKSSTTYQIDKKNGIYQALFQNGRKDIAGQYKNDKKEGTWKYYFNTPRNTVSAEITYHNNAIVKKRYLNEDGSEMKETKNADCKPQYPGGINALRFIIYRNLKYPERMKKTQANGSVIIAFRIDEEGTMKDIHISRRVNIYFDNEALRLINLAKKQWIPGKKFNRPAPYEMSYIIVFDPSKGAGLF